MPKQLIKISMERDSIQQKWGITIQGGSDLSLTAKIASVKVKLQSFKMENFIKSSKVLLSKLIFFLKK